MKTLLEKFHVGANNKSVKGRGEGGTSCNLSCQFNVQKEKQPAGVAINIPALTD